MKASILFTFVIAGFLASCTKEIQSNSEKSDDDNGVGLKYPQKWQLVSMSGSMVNSQTVGDDMVWQEFYILNADQTFTKSRTEDGKTVEVGGTYTFKEISNEEYLELNYFTDHEIIGNCTGEPHELLLILSPTKISGTWSACDGPGLEYEKVEVDE